MLKITSSRRHIIRFKRSFVRNCMGVTLNYGLIQRRTRHFCCLTLQKQQKIQMESLIHKQTYCMWIILSGEKKIKNLRGVYCVSLILVRPQDSYDNRNGEGYGERGGQDLVIIRLTSASWRHPACLPGPGLRDAGTEASLAGYGEYFRSTCQTDARGPMKYHYCQTDPLCMSEENCPPKFSDGLKSYSGCSKEDRTPARWSRLCSKFLHESKFEFRDNVDEVHLLEMDLEEKEEKGQYLETCYRQDPGHYGWCR